VENERDVFSKHLAQFHGSPFIALGKLLKENKRCVIAIARTLSTSVKVQWLLFTDAIAVNEYYENDARITGSSSSAKMNLTPVNKAPRHSEVRKAKELGFFGADGLTIWSEVFLMSACASFVGMQSGLNRLALSLSQYPRSHMWLVPGCVRNSEKLAMWSRIAKLDDS